MKRDRHSPRAGSLSILLCRDCCCGTESKHPDFDHARQERELREAVVEAGGRLHRVKCLDACSRSNVVVLRTHQHGKIWFGDMVNGVAHEDLASFVRGGAMGEIPESLAQLRFVPTAEAEQREVSCNLRGIPVYES